ncbi:hypothetical protein, partial [Staphylococcus auricularis]|uniref:hypothetical protein n=1 Tax=Staphylococcus auricularis TaxID=29379 RepID=UPI001783CF83
ILILIGIEKGFRLILLVVCFGVVVLSDFYFEHDEKVERGELNKMQEESEYEGVGRFREEGVKKGNELKGFVKVGNEGFKYSYYGKKEEDGLGEGEEVFHLRCEIGGELKRIKDEIDSGFELFIKCVDFGSCSGRCERQEDYLKQHEKFITDQL